MIEVEWVARVRATLAGNLSDTVKQFVGSPTSHHMLIYCLISLFFKVTRRIQLKIITLRYTTLILN